MPLIIKENYNTELIHKNKISLSKNICFPYPLKIGIINIMPFCHAYEFNLIHPLSINIHTVDLHWIKLESHVYKSTNKDYLNKFYSSFTDCIHNNNLDGIIITGAPVEKLPFNKVYYWKEILDIIEYCKINKINCLGICWGGFAILKKFNIEKISLTEKLLGLFSLKCNGKQSDKYFYSIQNRYAMPSNKDIQHAVSKNVLKSIAYSEKVGHAILETMDQNFLVNLGHPEYNTNNILYNTNTNTLDILDGVGGHIGEYNYNYKNKEKNNFLINRDLFFKNWLDIIYNKKLKKWV